MIFKQIDAILSGAKTQTRRLVKPGEELWPVDPPCEIVTSAGRIKWETFSRTYAVQPGRGQPEVMWSNYGGGIQLLHEHRQWNAVRQCHNSSREAWQLALANLRAAGWKPLRIRSLSIRREPLQAITEADALAEGVGSVAEYAALWDSINRKKGTRWAASPDVWVLTFNVVTP